MTAGLLDRCGAGVGLAWLFRGRLIGADVRHGSRHRRRGRRTARAARRAIEAAPGRQHGPRRQKLTLGIVQPTDHRLRAVDVLASTTGRLMVIRRGRPPVDPTDPDDASSRGDCPRGPPKQNPRARSRRRRRASTDVEDVSTTSTSTANVALDPIVKLCSKPRSAQPLYFMNPLRTATFALSSSFSGSSSASSSRSSGDSAACTSAAAASSDTAAAACRGGSRTRASPAAAPPCGWRCRRATDARS